MNFIKENWKPVLVFLILVGFIPYIFIKTADNDTLKQKYDGLVVTDKAGKSYMLQYSGRVYFTVKEFDVEKMRLRGQ